LIKLPIVNKNFNTSLTKERRCALRHKTKRRGIKVFENDQQLCWMKSSIDLSHTENNSIRISVARTNSMLDRNPMERGPNLKGHNLYGSFNSVSNERPKLPRSQIKLKPFNERVPSHHSNFARVAANEYC
jgi:hypothetical protein